jgi:hypothetical protein
MILNEIQKQEVADYVRAITRYMETYDELYDHILSSLSSENHESFNMGLVFKIINEDFGGIEKIKQEEECSQKALYRSFHTSMIWEMVKAFKSLESLCLLVLGCVFYYGGATYELKKNIVLISLVVMIFTPVILYVYKACYKEKGHIKPSNSNYALRDASFFGMNAAMSMYFVFLTKDPIIKASTGTQFIIMLCLYFFLSVYLRAYLSVFRKSYKLKLN